MQTYKKSGSWQLSVAETNLVAILLNRKSKSLLKNRFHHDFFKQNWFYPIINLSSKLPKKWGIRKKIGSYRVNNYGNINITVFSLNTF